MEKLVIEIPLKCLMSMVILRDAPGTKTKREKYESLPRMVNVLKLIFTGKSHVQGGPQRCAPELRRAGQRVSELSKLVRDERSQYHMRNDWSAHCTC